MSRSTIGQRLFALIFVCTGLFSLVSAVSTLTSQRVFLASAATAEGRVAGWIIDHLPVEHSTTAVAFPRIEFTAANGETVEFVWRHASSPPRYAVGQRVSVRYAPEDPRQAEVADSSQWEGVKITGLVGVGFTLFGVLMLFIRPPGQGRSRRAA
jgi:hypothetical protein